LPLQASPWALNRSPCKLLSDCHSNLANNTSSLPPATIGGRSSPAALACRATPFAVLTSYFSPNKTRFFWHHDSSWFSSSWEGSTVNVESTRHVICNDDPRPVDCAQTTQDPHLTRPALSKVINGLFWAEVEETVTSKATITHSPVFAIIAVAIAVLPCVEIV